MTKRTRPDRKWPRFLQLRGRRYRLEVCNIDGGSCDHPDKADKAIRISRRARNENLLRILIHEQMHALNWDEAEESVDEKSDILAHNLWRLGLRWRWEENHEQEG